MFTLYGIGFCSASEVAPIQCEQELMFCCGAEIVPKRSQFEQKPYSSFDFKRSFTSTKFCCNFCSDKVFRFDSDRFKNLSDTERSTFMRQWSGAVVFPSRNCVESSVPTVNRSPIWYTFRDALFHYPAQCEHSLNSLVLVLIV